MSTVTKAQIIGAAMGIMVTVVPLYIVAHRTGHEAFDTAIFGILYGMSLFVWGPAMKLLGMDSLLLSHNFWYAVGAINAAAGFFVGTVVGYLLRPRRMTKNDI